MKEARRVQTSDVKPSICNKTQTQTNMIHDMRPMKGLEIRMNNKTECEMF